MDRITRHPIMQDIPFETVVDYAVDFIRIVGSPPTFFEKTAIVKIKNYRGELPCDFYEMIQVRLMGGYEGDHLIHGHNRVFRYSTDSFHMSPVKAKFTDLTYKIQGNCIFTAPLEEGEIEVAYKALPIDEEGYPLIPDNTAFSRALELYIKKQWFTVQFDLGKINQQVMAKVDQDYAWAVGQAQTDLIRPTIDQMQSITNMWNTLLPRHNEHRKGFLKEGMQEHYKNH